MRRSAIVLNTGIVSLPDGGGDALAIVTDFPQPDESAFYLRPDSVPPIVGQQIAYGDAHATYIVDGREVTAREIGYNYDWRAPLG